MAVEIYKIKTSSGSINTYFGHPLDFLTKEEKEEFDTIGYSGKNSKGEKTSYTEFLNSLGKGEFKVEQTKFDNGDFSEEFIVARSLTKEVVALMEKLVVRGCFRGTESEEGRNYEIAIKTFKEITGLDYEEEVDKM